MQLDNKILIAELENLSKVLAPWRDQLVVGGGVALVIYDLILSKANSGAVGTTDIDILIPRKTIQHGDFKISTALIDNGFELKNKSTDTPSVQSFTKQVSQMEIEVEFLTDNKSRKQESVVAIETAGVNAQALSYIEMSLQEAMPISLNNGEKILIVRPEAWIFHKGLTFTRRTIENKKYKDLYGIWFVLTQLGATSIAVQKSLSKLRTSLPVWNKTFKSNLKTWIDNASPKDWDRLAAQDINGVLSKNSFNKAISSL